MSERNVGGKSAATVGGRAGWRNEDNFPFYARIGVEGLKERAAQCGLLDCADLNAISHWVGPCFFASRPTTVLEIGAGYGRVADWLLEGHENLHLTLLEPSPPSAAYLRERFWKEERVAIRQTSILALDSQASFRLALWLWAGFLDFTLEEKAAALVGVARALVPGGLAAVEVPVTVGEEVSHPADRTLTLDYRGARWQGYVPSKAEIGEIARAAGLQLVAELPYLTSTKLRRIIYLFQSGKKDAPRR